jgi:hypothetical protein
LERPEALNINNGNYSGGKVAERWKQILRLALFAISGAIFPAAHAQWLPEWTGVWQHPEPVRTAGPLRLQVAADGSIFAVVSVTHHSVGRVDLVRFNHDGGFAWTREGTGSDFGGLVVTDGGRVAIAGNSSDFATVYVRVYDALTGNLVWQRDIAEGHTSDDRRVDRQQMAIDTSGNLMVVVSAGHDYVVMRFDADGNALPTWRHTVGSGDGVTSFAIVALPDGGAVISGQAGFHGSGYVTVRFDAMGDVVFAHQELGALGNPLGSSSVALDGDGNFVLAASPESLHGQPLAQVWKLSADGVELWKRELPFGVKDLRTTMIGGFQLAANGDPLVVVNQFFGPFRLVRLAASTGEIVWDVNAPVGGVPQTLALAPNGRTVIGGYEHLIGIPGGLTRMIEFDANGQPCRIASNSDQFRGVEFGASDTGWTILSSTESSAGVGEAVVYRYDADGPCSLNDLVFASGFDEIMSPK